MLGLVFAALIWGIFFGVAGFIVGSCQPVRPELASAPVERATPWTVARCLYLLVVGILLGFICSHVGLIIWIGVFFLLEGWDLNRQGPRTSTEMVAAFMAASAMGTSAIAAFLASVLGTFFGSTIRTAGPRSAMVRTALFAGVLGIVFASILSLLPAFIMGIEFTRARQLGHLDELMFTSWWVLIVELGILAGIAAAWVSWRLLRGRASEGPQSVI
jgi:hypothetical protein